MDDCYSIFELYERNDCQFGFFVTNWHPVHYKAEVVSYGYFAGTSQPKQWFPLEVYLSQEMNTWNHRFLCNLYSLNTGESVKQNIEIVANHEKLWLPA